MKIFKANPIQFKHYTSIGIDSDETNPVDIEYIREGASFFLIKPCMIIFRFFRICLISACINFLDSLEEFILHYLDFFKT